MTIFSNPIFTPPLRVVSRIFLKVAGWRCDSERPEAEKYVAVMAPHTSNWDFLYFIAAALVYRLDLKWIGKHTLFKGLMGPCMRWLGGVAVDRNKSTGAVSDAVDFLKRNTSAAVAIAPEGTRKSVKNWKTGFYRIAVEAEVPILLSFLDYKTKTAGLGPLITPTEDMEGDLKGMREFYEPYEGKNSRVQPPKD